MVRIKICGITRMEDAEAAVSAGVNALGFIFVPQSPRYILPEAAGKIVSALPPFISTVGVFAGESRERIGKTVSACGLSAIQLHGNETPEECSGFSRPVIKAFRMDDSFNEELVSGYNVSGFLLDTAVKGMFGGTGKTFDWKRAVPVKAFGPVILSGGLNPDNIAEAVSTVEPYGVDVSSGVEISPGVKDHEKIFKLMRNFRQTP